MATTSVMFSAAVTATVMASRVYGSFEKCTSYTSTIAVV